ncbi:MAG: arsenic efflux protein, partial [Lachnospiraceae bacterium]|nr:arsenic efflux protein [Lachnospiraceae bacterium]
EEVLAQMILNKPIAGPLIAGLVGLIPNCASSVIITRLFLEGALGLGAMMAGLLVNAGVGVLVLFRVNKDKMENIKILVMMYAIGVIAGIVLGFLPIQF